MSKRERIKQAKLEAMKAEFHELLIPCLTACAAGRYGLFEQNAHLDPEDRYLTWSEARELKALAKQILAESLRFGEEDTVAERFLSLCELKGPNVPGEPKLAVTFLDELQKRPKQQ